ncbi:MULTISPECIES: phage tail protein [Burkholderiaceae]|uniref:phage tail protein n=1 Tax=Burkholderiaceae TaxID=119060 RepID=UPI00095CFD38|nr:phage tail protein [Mycetohabitans sp. B7]MCG1040904.1 phage tail protein [Mycetohabitans sp. B7]SIT64874.1 conserved hypothetical phage tail region protein [Burkholderia sp. b14]
MNDLDFFTPSVAHRFIATVFISAVPSPMDIAFQRISGLSRELQVTQHRQGGDNKGNVHLPEQLTHGTLVLERGVMLLTPLTAIFNSVLGEFDSHYLTVVVMLLNDVNLPVSTWTATDAMPLKWETGDLDATSNTVLINRFELAYHELLFMGINA